MTEKDHTVSCSATGSADSAGYDALDNDCCDHADEQKYEIDPCCPLEAEASGVLEYQAPLHQPQDVRIDKKELHIAPMLDFSKREFRKLFSILSTRLVVWTDMVVDETIAHSDTLDDILEPDRDLPNRQICQIGGNCPDLCGNATKVVELVYGYDEVNLNIDCPSDRVSGEREFGAALMKKVDVAYNVLESMKNNVSSEETSNNKKTTPVSIKCRIGVDDLDDLEFISTFIERLRPVCKRFYLHARKCVLNGLYSPRENRSVPPINYPRVYALCRKFPDVDIWINGGIRNLVQAKSICYGSSDPKYLEINHSQIPCPQCNLKYGSCMAPPYEAAPPNLLGCMMGRTAIDNPSIFWDVDRYFYGMEKNPCQNRRQVLEKYASYLDELYPKRCCDTEEESTHRLPVPQVSRLCNDCPICRDTSQTVSDEQQELDEFLSSFMKKQKKPRISNRLIGRCFKPIRGLFYGLPGGKVYLHTLDKVAGDKSIRNCGPGFVLRRVIDQLPSDLLDQDFILSEVRGDVQATLKY